MHPEAKWIPRGDFQPLRYRPGGIGNWSGHLPFASDLVAAVRPGLFVELGTHYGESYFGFCQAITQHDIFCRCYAVDTWLGEKQAGSYDEVVYQEVHAYNQARYSRFSYLLRTTFDQAIENFSDDSIDILHIDGLHTYDAVSHDFHNWLPKVKAGGVVLLHDVAARHADFGVWKLWEDLADLGDRFLFPHSWGLGVFRKPAGSSTTLDVLSSLFHGDAATQNHLRKFYALCALKLDYDHDQIRRGISGEPVTIGVQVFPQIAGDYSPAVCYETSYQSGSWQKLRIELSKGIGEGALRIDPAQEACLLDVAAITVRTGVRDEIVWAAVGPDITSLPTGGDLCLLGIAGEGGFCRFLSTGTDPQLYLPPLAGNDLDQPLYCDVWLRGIVEIAPVLKTLKSQYLDRDKNRTGPEPGISSEAVEANPQTDIGPAARALSECNAALDHLRKEHAELLKQSESLTQEKTFLMQSHRKLQGDLYVAKTDAERVKTERDEAVHARNLHAMRCQQLEQTIEQMANSRSWRLTAPLRNFRQLIR